MQVADDKLCLGRGLLPSSDEKTGWAGQRAPSAAEVVGSLREMPIYCWTYGRIELCRLKVYRVWSSPCLIERRRDRL